ncbi:HutD family protein [Hwanghaeella grinnelliae]|nr:HutD family protein [Hwanghaeella grinnelliae]
MPWKNGGGSTREIWKVEDADGILWRASIATIHQSGPFSLFSGCDRIITLIDGPPVTLDFEDGETLTLETFAPRSFSCDRPVSAAIAGTSHDLNLIWRRDAVSVAHQVQAVKGETPLTLPPAHWHLVVVCDGAVGVAAGGMTETLATGEALLFGPTPKAQSLDLTFSTANGVVLTFGMTERSELTP